MYPTDWLTWASGTLTGIGAPVNDTNLATLWNWTAAEKPHPTGAAATQWNNPLNTTQPASGASSVNSVGVKSYPDIGTGVNATVQTLLNGHYPNIISNLRASTPASGWGNACSDLGVWGTGCSWIGNAAPNVGSIVSGLVSGPTAVVSAGAAAGSGLSSFAKLGTCLTNPHFWWRVGFTTIGAVLIAWGLYSYFSPRADAVATRALPIAAEA